MNKQFLILLFVFITKAYAQIEYVKKDPISFDKNYNIKSVETIVLDAPIILDSKYNSKLKDQPEVFAHPIPVNFSIDNNGVWQNIEGGDIWQLKLKSNNAKNLSIQFSDFYIPDNCEFYIYSEDKKDLRGAFTLKNNREDNTFAIYLVKGETIVLEFFRPENCKEKPQIKFSNVFHGLKGLRDFDDSGSCNNNVNCIEGADWQNEKRAVALILSGGVSGITWCSGAMVNNVREDGTPYFLTADHCLTGTENNWAIIYNYESPNCTDIDGSYNESVLGATVLANSSSSDFALLLLDDTPPISYNIYHAGWDARDLLKDSVVGIHHPQGDIKKISFDYDSVKTSGYNGGAGGSPGNDHWEVLDWDDGTTEPVSSGSPLFDKDHKIIGQLHGGYAACSNDDQDLYGKFSFSWNEGATASTRLMDWLDPDSSGSTVLNGNDFNTSQFALDLALISNDLDLLLCDTLVDSFKVFFKNLGSDTITSLKIKLEVDGDSIQEVEWFGNLGFSFVSEIQFNSLSVSPGARNFNIYITKVNNLMDDNQLNDSINRVVKAFNGNEVEVKVTTDNFGSENSIEFYSQSDSIIVHSSSGYPDFATDSKFYCLENGCYDFKLKDSYGDGITNGGASLFVNGVLINTIDGNDFDYVDSISFCIYDGVVTSSVYSIDLAPLEIYKDSSVCDQLKDSLEFKIINYGYDTVMNFKTLIYDNGLKIDSANWNVVVLPGQMVDLSIPHTLEYGSHNINLKVLNNLDSNSINNTWIENITLRDGKEFSLEFYTGSLGPDLVYQVFNNLDSLIYTGTDYNFNDSVSVDFCLDSGCYKIAIQNEGPSGVLSANFSFSFQNEVIATFNDIVEDSIFVNFCFDGDEDILNNSGWVTKSIYENVTNKISIFPNPSEDVFNIASLYLVDNIQVYDALGRNILTLNNLNTNREEINLGELNRGIYYLQINTDITSNINKIVVK